MPASLLGVLAMVLCVVMSATQAAAQYTVASGQLLWLSKPTGHVQYLRINVPAGTKTLNLGINGATGDVDLYARHGTAPVISPTATGQYGAYSTWSGSTAVQSIAVNDPEPGIWYIAIHAYQGYTNLKFRGTIRLANAQNVWVRGGERSMQVFSFYVPEGTPTVSFRISPHVSTAGDPDLFVKRGSIATNLNHTWASTAVSGAQDTVTIPNPDAGTYYVTVYGFNAFVENNWLLSAATADLNQPLGMSVTPVFFHRLGGHDLALRITNTSDHQIQIFSIWGLRINGQDYTFNLSTRPYIQPGETRSYSASLPQGTFVGFQGQQAVVSVNTGFYNVSVYQSVGLTDAVVTLP